MAAVAEDGELHPGGPAVVEERLDRRPHGAAGVEDVVDEDDGPPREVEVEVGGVDDGLAGGLAAADVVAVEGDVDVPERDLRPAQLADQRVQATGQDRAPGVDADERQAL